jgi:RNA polymerase sigma factor (TIGR02999 family)
MSEITRLLDSMRGGDPVAGERLLPLLYSELRAVAAKQMVEEKAGHTLTPTALVHEAYLRLVGDQYFESRGHFFAAAAKAMRRILVENARRKQRIRHGGQVARQPFDLNDVSAPPDDVELLALHECLEQMATEHPRKAQLVELRFFSGMTLAEAAKFLGISPATADRDWRYARAWLYDAMSKRSGSP